MRSDVFFTRLQNSKLCINFVIRDTLITVHLFEATCRLTIVKKNRQNGEGRKKSDYL